MQSGQWFYAGRLVESRRNVVFENRIFRVNEALRGLYIDRRITTGERRFPKIIQTI